MRSCAASWRSERSRPLVGNGNRQSQVSHHVEEQVVDADVPNGAAAVRDHGNLAVRSAISRTARGRSSVRHRSVSARCLAHASSCFLLASAPSLSPSCCAVARGFERAQCFWHSFLAMQTCRKVPCPPPSTITPGRACGHRSLPSAGFQLFARIGFGSARSVWKCSVESASTDASRSCSAETTCSASVGRAWTSPLRGFSRTVFTHAVVGRGLELTRRASLGTVGGSMGQRLLFRRYDRHLGRRQAAVRRVPGGPAPSARAA